MGDEARIEYWDEALGDSLCQIDRFDALTSEERREVAKHLAGWAESQSMAFYTPEAPEPRAIKRLEGELKKERSKIVCRECHGEGRLRYSAGPWAVNTGCHVCHGEGRHLP